MVASVQEQDASKVSVQDRVVGKFLSFYLAEEEYGIQILKVREIIGVVDITPLPRMPEYVRGVINLRGKIIPVVELRAKFKMDHIDYDDDTCIIVVDVELEGGDVLQMGCIVDSVCEVLTVSRDQIEPPPRCAGVTSDYILALGKLESKVLIMLDIEKLLASCGLEAAPSGH